MLFFAIKQKRKEVQRIRSKTFDFSVTIHFLTINNYNYEEVSLVFYLYFCNCYE